MARRAHRAAKVPRPAPTPPVSAGPFKVFLTASAKEAYVELARRSAKAVAAGDPTNSHCTTFRMVDDAIQRLIPADPSNRRYALAAPLNGLFRIRKGRIRICWMAHGPSRRLLVVFISDSPRKEGDAKDPYKVLTGLLKAGYFQDVYDDWIKLTDTGPNPTVQ